MSQRTIEKLRYWGLSKSRMRRGDEIGELGPLMVQAADELATVEKRLEDAKQFLVALPASIPHTWLDPLLSGPDAVIDGFNVPSIGAILRAVRKRQQDAIDDWLAAQEEAS